MDLTRLGMSHRDIIKTRRAPQQTLAVRGIRPISKALLNSEGEARISDVARVTVATAGATVGPIPVTDPQPPHQAPLAMEPEIGRAA
jgi:hypothetical protein